MECGSITPPGGAEARPATLPRATPARPDKPQHLYALGPARVDIGKADELVRTFAPAAAAVSALPLSLRSSVFRPSNAWTTSARP